MNNSEKRILEICLTLILQNIRKDNSNALTDIKNFLQGPSFIKNYNPEFLYTTCLENLEILEKIPSRIELILALTTRTDPKSSIKITSKLYKSLGIKPISASEKRISSFSIAKTSLYPKIKNKDFHQHLLTFFQNYSIINSNIPIK